MIRYVFRDSPLITNNVENADAQTIGEALAKIASANQGQLTPEATVEAAKNRRHPLHQFFEWNDEKAASAYRLSQARMIIRSIAIEGDEEAEAVPAFHSISDKGGRSYRSHEEVLSSARLQRLVVEQAKKDLINFRQRYKRLAEIFEPAISATIERLEAENNDHPV